MFLTMRLNHHPQQRDVERLGWSRSPTLTWAQLHGNVLSLKGILLNQHVQHRQSLHIPRECR
jgi:hypothetical protein